METITLAHLTDAVNERETENRALAYEAACEGMVLLKNEGLLPFAKGQKIAVFGKAQADYVKGGGGSGERHNCHNRCHIDTSLDIIRTSAARKREGFGRQDEDYRTKGRKPRELHHLGGQPDGRRPLCKRGETHLRRNGQAPRRQNPENECRSKQGGGRAPRQ